MRSFWLIALLATALLGEKKASAESVFESPGTKTSLLELFTSEGCSSCPPAEAWLGRLKDSPELWSGFVPVAFHVDYWNRLGWSDRFSSPEFTKRQEAYAAAGMTGRIYTPEFVLNGAEWLRADGLPTASTVNAGRLRAKVDDSGHVEVSFRPAEKISGPLFAEVVPLGSGVSIDVRAGENAGRKLKHEFLALGLVRGELLRAEDGEFQGRISLPEKKEIHAAAVAVWVRSSHSQSPLQVTGGWLEVPEIQK